MSYTINENINNIKYSFKNDYSEGAHPNILNSLIESNLEQNPGYGYDKYCFEAKKLIIEQLHNEAVDIHFVPGGTQANLIVISSILRPFESVIATNTGHINVHETGAIEATGHKVSAGKYRADGKLLVSDIEEVLSEHCDEHMVKPKMVYISNSTEVGTIYKKAELKEIYDFCKKNNLYLFLDGARLGSALTSKENDLTLEDLTKLTDVFYIGGTKNGALIGEAIIINNDNLKQDFRYMIKQRGALLAKGKLLGIQFIELFKENLFFDLAKHSNVMAEKLHTGLKELGISFLNNSSTNQIFPIIPNTLMDDLNKIYDFTYWAKESEDKSIIRLCTSWATDENAIDEFLKDVQALIK
ncbi:MAG: threonine aldolase family protein [Sarcina sp.]